MKHFVRVSIGAFALIGALAAPSAVAVSIREFSLPGTANPYYIAPALDGDLYVTDYTGNLWRLDHTKLWLDDPFAQIALPSGSTPLHVMPGLDGRPVWLDIARNKLCFMGRELAIPTADALPRGMAAYRGQIWFAGYLADKLFTTSLVGISSVSLAAGSHPYDVAVGGDGNLWFTEYGGNKIGRYADGQVTTFDIPTPGGLPTNLVTGRDGMIWFAELIGNKIGRIDPLNTAAGITEFSIPTPGAYPMDLVLGSDGRVWFTESHTGKVARIEMTGVIKEYALPSGPASAPYGITVGPDGSLWVVERGPNKVARIVLNVPGDANGDGVQNVADVFYLINWLFAGGTPPTY